MPKIRLYNPFRKRSSSSKKRRVRRVKARRRKSNTGGTLTFMANPHRRRRRHNASHSRRRRRSNPFRRPRVHKHHAGGRRRRRNPFMKVRRIRRRSRNPFGGGAVGQTAIKAAWAIGGGILARSLPQTILGASNTGFMGYAANAATTAVAAMAAGKFFGPSASEGVIIGGAVMTVGRIVEDFLGQNLVTFAQLNMPGSGQPLLSSDRRYGMRGDFENFNFPVPYSSLGPASRPAICPPAASVPAMARGMAGVWGGGNPWNN